MAINFPANPSINDTFIVSGTIFTWTGVKWKSTAVTEISSDTSPQLGGTLDANSQNINNVNNLVVDGNLTVQGTTTTIDTAVTAVDSLNVDGAVVVGAGISAVGDVSIGGHVGNHTVNGLWLESSGDIRVTGSSSNTIWAGYQNGTAAATSNINADGTATFAGTVSDSKGGLRDVPLNDQSSSASYTLTASDAGKVVHAHSTTTTVVVPNSVFSVGNVVTILNGGTSNISISQGSGLSLRNSGDGSTGNRTLAQYGMATIYFTGASVGYISGSNMT